VERGDLGAPVLRGRRLRVGGELDEVNEDHADEALGGAPLRVAHVLDLLGDVLQVELVGQVAPARREAAQARRLLLGPGADVLIVERRDVHRRGA
jgi:hypothetical protein